MDQLAKGRWVEYGGPNLPALQVLDSKRLRRSSEMSWPVSPRVARSAMISPYNAAELESVA